MMAVEYTIWLGDQTTVEEQETKSISAYGVTLEALYVARFPGLTNRRTARLATSSPGGRGYTPKSGVVGVMSGNVGWCS